MADKKLILMGGRRMWLLTFSLQIILLLTTHIEVQSFYLSDMSKSVQHPGSSSKSHYQYKTYKCTTSTSDQSHEEKVSEDKRQEAILSESVMNNRLVELGSEPIDFALLKRTIAEWSKPLPTKYFSQPLILVGPSGVGKGRLVKALLKDYKRFFVKIVTHTTRSPRPDEIDGKSYHFVSNSSFHDMVNQKQFLEWAKVHDNFYGTSIEAFQIGRKSGKISIMEIDIQGARSVKAISQKHGMKPKYLFIAPPAIEKLQERLALRGTETPEQVSLRIASAEQEMLHSQEEGLFNHVLVNDKFDDTVNTFFRFMRDWYPALPSAARIRMLQRRLKSIKSTLNPTDPASSPDIETNDEVNDSTSSTKVDLSESSD